MDVRIRRAEPRDVPRMLELVRELAVFEKAPHEVTVTLAHMHDAGFGPVPVWTGWVAEHVDGPSTGGTIVGMAICYVRYSTWKGRRLYLEDIIVTERARGQGIGARLFRACAAHALEQGHDGMTWQVLHWNTDAIRFYERLGAKLDPEWVNGALDRDGLRAVVGGG